MRISDWSSDVCSSDLVDVDAGGAGRFRAVQVAQVDAVVGRQRTRQLAARVVAERADERRARAGARAGHGLVETLAAGPGGVAAAERLARPRQHGRGPDVVDVERADDDAPAHAAAPAIVTAPARLRAAKRRVGNEGVRTSI